MEPTDKRITFLDTNLNCDIPIACLLQAVAKGVAAVDFKSRENLSAEWLEDYFRTTLVGMKENLSETDYALCVLLYDNLAQRIAMELVNFLQES